MPHFSDAKQASEELSQPKHTPAPWGCLEGTGRIFYADGDVEPSIAYVDIENTTPEQANADCRLIASAPKLLEALTKAEVFISGFEGDELQEGMSELLLEIRAALAKATGQQMKLAA